MSNPAETDGRVSSGGLMEWLPPMAFFAAMAWAVWHAPAYILTLIPHENESQLAQVTALHERKDFSPWLPGMFGGKADILDWLAIILIPIIFFWGIRNIKIAKMEFQHWRAVDRGSIFIGRVTMILIVAATMVMLYEVFLRYALERPTIWANEMTLWIAGFIFLCSGLYGMQQRSHIRIFLLYDAVPRWLQRVFDTVWTILFVIFAFFLVFGSYKQVFVTKFYKWEMWGTAFDPPIPATVQPAVLIVIVLVAIQAVLNLISDWNLEPEVHESAEIDEDEIEALKRSVGAD